MNPLYVLGHLGLGDHILCNGLIRFLSKRHDEIRIPCYLHNYTSVQFMFRDLKNVLAVAVVDENDAISLCKNKNYLGLGYYSTKGFDPKYFDTEFYRQANVDFSERFTGFHVDLHPVIGNWDQEGYAFIHDDETRGFVIDTNKIHVPIVRPIKISHIFNNYNLIRNADQIHCINSSFLILVDSLPEIPGQELFFHRYARPTDYPQLRRKWKIYE